MSRRKTTCGLYPVEHLRECADWEGRSECECGCDVNASCVGWHEYVLAMNKKYPPLPKEPVRRKKDPDWCPF